MTRKSLLARVACLGAALTVCAAVVATATGTAAAQVTWTAVSAPLPANAVAGEGITLTSDSCPGFDWCVAVGNYPAQRGGAEFTAGLILLQAGTFSRASAAPLPDDAAADPQALLESVSCSAVGACVAVGRYVDAGGATQGLIERLSGDVWRPTELALPAGALTSGPDAYAQLSSVTCPSSSWCAAVGVYTPSSGAQLSLVDTLSAGTWTSAAAPAPVAGDGSQFLSLSCPTVGYCVAAGTYLSGSFEVAMAYTLASGSWTEQAVPLPAGASPFSSIANNDLDVTCPGIGACTIAGTVFDGTYWGLLDTLSGGSWTPSSAPQPAGTSSTDVQLTGVSCADAADCVAVGFVQSSGIEQGLLETLAAGTWTASVAPVPLGTSPTADVDVQAVNCTTDAICVADGQVDSAGDVTGQMLDLQNGSWTAYPAPLPGDAQSSPDPAFTPITCPALGACLVAGTYLGASGREGVLETDPSLPPTTTSASLALAGTGSVTYSASVAGVAGPPTGTVEFASGPELLCSAPLANGAATCTGPLGPAASVLASYSGDEADAPSAAQLSNPYGPTTVTAVSTPSAAKVDKDFSSDLVAEVTNASGAPVPGVAVTFTAPAADASAEFLGYTTVATNAAGLAVSPPLEAITKKGSYDIVATASGVSGEAVFSMTNLAKS